MLVVAVANTKGGTGKTTVAVHLAAAFARDHKTALLDLDRQQCARGWAARRPRHLPRVRMAKDADIDVERLVIDCPANKRGGIDDIVAMADVIVVPVLPSAFDETGTLAFLARLHEIKAIRKGKRAVCAVGNRARSGDLSTARLRMFLNTCGVPEVGILLDRPDYVQAATTGVTAFDRPASAPPGLIEEWRSLLGALAELDEPAVPRAAK